MNNARKQGSYTNRRSSGQVRCAAAPATTSEEFRFKFLGVTVLTGISLFALFARLAVLG